jgi:ribonuclease HI
MHVIVSPPMRPVALNLREDAINVFPDGSSRASPRLGGIGFRIVTFDSAGNEVCEDEWLPGYRDATNQQMELLACIEGIRAAIRHPVRPKFNRICVYTDSQYVQANVDRAKYTWPASRWRRASRAPVLNAELWRQLVKLIREAPCRIDIRWAKGHSKGNPHNKAADKLAKRSSEVAVNAPLSVVHVRRRTTKERTVLGSVRMEGQVVAIRVLGGETLRRQRLAKYRYEVISPDSKYFGNVDVIYADSTLDIRAGHHYEVRVNTEPKNARIVELVRELER